MATAPVTRGAAGERAAQNIERFRKDQGLNQKDVAERLKEVRPMLPTVVSKIERGDRRIDVDDLAAFADVLAVSPLALLDLKQWEKLEGILYGLLLFVAESGEPDNDLFSQSLNATLGMRVLTPEHAETAIRVYSAMKPTRAAKLRERQEYLASDAPPEV